MNPAAVTVRPEVPADKDAIRAIQVAAFADHPFSQQTEHLIVDALRADDALSVSLVAEVDGTVRGHVAFSRVTIGETRSGWYALGPIGVDPAFQSSGIGSALVEAGLDALRALRAAGCVLVGEPGYYARFGFRNEPSVTFADVPPQYVLCLSLGGPIPAGQVEHHTAFSILPEERG